MRFDVVVVGGGAVGASVVRAMRGLSVALVAGVQPASLREASSGPFDARVYALSPGSVGFLRSVKVWDAVAPERLAPVHEMRIYGDAPGGRLEMDAYRAGVAELAWIVEDRVLQGALWSALGTQDGLEIFAPASCASVELRDGHDLGGCDHRRWRDDAVG